jgi:methionyl-tRNA formyltransferase
MQHNIRFAFFGTSLISVHVLEELAKTQLHPQLIIATPDLPQGKNREIVASPVKRWADTHGIPIIQPTTLKDETLINQLSQEPWDVFIVASYGKIIPKAILDIPKHGCLNVHPSLLPLLRGPAPMPASILLDMQDTGVTIIKMDEQVDHGPIVAQEKIHVEPWPLPYLELEKILGSKGGELLASTLPDWIEGKITATEQDHTKATFTQLMRKADGEIKLDDDQYTNWLKFNAYQPWPGVFYIDQLPDGTMLRVIITDATYSDEQFVIRKVKPEGRREMLYADYLRGRR